MAPEVSFYFDLGSPYVYLAAERLSAVLPTPVQWRPVLLGGLFRLSGRSSWALTDGTREDGMAEVERRARDYGLPPVQWPEGWPSNYLFAMRAATHALGCGRGPEFALQALRAAFQQGADLSQPEVVLQVASATGVDAEELPAAASDPRIKAALRAATDTAFARGVTGVPTVAVDEVNFWGDDRLDDAAAYLRSMIRP